MGNQPPGLRWTKPGEAEQLRSGLLDFERATRLGRQAQALSDPNRLTLLALLSEAKRTCVGDLCLISGREQSGVSRHLRVLLDTGLVQTQRFERLIVYEPSERGQQLLTALLVGSE